jgi:hypothetical protein
VRVARVVGVRGDVGAADESAARVVGVLWLETSGAEGASGLREGTVIRAGGSSRRLRGCVL